MWARIFASVPPSPPPAKDAPQRKVQQLLDEEEVDARPPPAPPKKQTHHSIRPIFYNHEPRKADEDVLSIDVIRNQRPHPEVHPPTPEHPLIKDLQQNYAKLRVTLHSSSVKKVGKTQEALTLEAEEKIDAYLAKLSAISSEERQISTSCCDVDVDTEVTTRDNQKRTVALKVSQALSEYEKNEEARSIQLSKLWRSWENTQADINKISIKLQALHVRDPDRKTREISMSNYEWAEQLDNDIGRQSKQVVEEMMACEDELLEELEDEARNITKVFLDQ